MDSSTRLVSSANIVLGTTRVSHSELRATDWATIVDAVVGELKPTLKYASGFVPLADYINKPYLADRERSFSTAFRLPKSFPIQVTARCYRVLELGHVQARRLESGDFKGKKITDLMLTDKGVWFSLQVTFDIVHHQDQGAEKGVERVKHLRISPLTSNELGTVLASPKSFFGAIGRQVLLELQKIVQGDITIRQERILAAQSCLDTLNQVISRIT